MVSSQFLRFIIFSVFTNGSGLFLAISLNLLGISTLISSSTSYVYAVVVSYVLQAKYTFRAEVVAISARTAKFIITHAFGFCFNAFTIYVLTILNDIEFFPSQLISTILCGVSIFFLNKYWVFRLEARNEIDSV